MGPWGRRGESWPGSLTRTREIVPTRILPPHSSIGTKILDKLPLLGVKDPDDSGPRLLALIMGLGPIAIPGPNGLWWAYIIGPLLGGPVGATLYDLMIRTASMGQEHSVVYDEAPDPQGMQR